MKRAAFVLPLLLLTLTACGGGSSTAVACIQQFWNGAFGVCLPDGWTVLDRESLASRGVPEQVLVAFQRETAVSGQMPTVTVTSETLPTPLTTVEYSRASVQSVTTLPGYTQLDMRSTDIEGQKADLHVFTAQPVAGEPERRFFQISAVGAKVGYTVTALTPVSISDTLEKEVTLILSSLRFTEPVEE